jgi:2-polyprenyl-6-methoxyphenol hydroxylase-like FAD-dependent oxidoreductase
MGTALIAGGGIGGLAAAIALYRAGWQVEVLEQAPEFGEVGAGLTLWPNALRALDHIGLGDRIRAVGRIDATAGIRDSHGRWITRVDTREVERRFGPTVVIHRAELVAMLADAVPAGVLRPDTKVISARLDGGGVVVTHSGGESRADLLVGADGLRSVVRGQFWPDTRPVYSGLTAWRTVLDRPGERLGAGGLFLGRGQEIGALQLPHDQVYLLAGAITAEGGGSPDSELAELRRRFGDWTEPIGQLLDHVVPEKILRHDVYYVPKLKTYVHGPVVLIGDAAHGMMPNLGQGGCQALEDAATLGAVIDEDVPKALARYESHRLGRSQWIAGMARQAGRLCLTNSAVLAAVRDRGMRLLPASLMLRSLTKVYMWAPPD